VDSGTGVIQPQGIKKAEKEWILAFFATRMLRHVNEEKREHERKEGRGALSRKTGPGRGLFFPKKKGATSIHEA